MNAPAGCQVIYARRISSQHDQPSLIQSGKDDCLGVKRRFAKNPILPLLGDCRGKLKNSPQSDVGLNPMDFEIGIAFPTTSDKL
jgi:hypothetical protein